MKRVFLKPIEASANQSGAMETATISKTGDVISHTSRGNFLRKACFAFLAAGIIFCGCSKDDGTPSSSAVASLDVKVSTGSASVDVVKIMVWDNVLHKDVAIAEGPYSNGGFKIDLPDDLDSKYLGNYEIIEYDGVTASNKNAKVTFADIVAFNGDKIVGYFYYEGETSRSETGADLMYADSDVSFTGSGSEKDEDETHNWSYSVYLKKGWNWVYEIEEWSANEEIVTEKATTTKPSGLKWVFERYY